MRRVLLFGRGSLACVAVFMGAALVHAQAPKVKVEVRGERDRPVRASRAPRVSSIIGAAVALEGNTSVGKVDDLVIGDDGYVEYLVVLKDDKYVLVPWGAAKIDYGRRSVALEIQKDRWSDIPTFTREAWPDLSDSKYVERIYTSYGVKRPARERRIDRKVDRQERRR